MRQYRSTDAGLIRELLRTARSNFKGEPEPQTGHTQRHRPPGLSQAAAARRLGIRTRMVQEWEAGIRPVPPARLESIAEVYGMTPAQRDELWLIVTGEYPPCGPSPSGTVNGWTLYVRGLQVPALAVDSAWNILEANHHWADLFEPAGQPVPHNLQRFILTDPYARQLCGNWKNDWALPCLRELRLEAHRSNDPALKSTVLDLQRDPDLAPLWKAATSVRIGFHSDTVRQLKPPATGRLHNVRLLVSSPMHDPRRRVITVLPTPEITVRGSTSTTRRSPESASSSSGAGLPLPGTGTVVWLPSTAAA